MRSLRSIPHNLGDGNPVHLDVLKSRFNLFKFFFSYDCFNFDQHDDSPSFMNQIR